MPVSQPPLPDTNAPITDEEKDILLNDSILRIPTPKQSIHSARYWMKKKNIQPTSIMLARKIGGIDSGTLLRVLFDSGSSKTMINKQALPPAARVRQMESKHFETIAGTFTAHESVKIRSLVLPEFDPGKEIYGCTAGVFDAPNCPHDVILGTDILLDIGFDILFSSGACTWMGKTVLMKAPGHWNRSTHVAMAFDDGFLDILDEDDDWFESFILDAKYEATSGAEVAAKQLHLTEAQRLLLAKALENTAELFDGKLGHYKETKVHLEVDPSAVPVHAKAYSVPQAHQAAFIRELKHLIKIGVLRPCGPTEWASPTFIIPKKDDRVRWISDLRELNKVLVRKVYPLPLIEEVISRRSGYKYFTKLDLTMMYYSFELDDSSKELCTIVTPYGKFQYCRMAMGLKPAPDIAQYHIEKTLHDLKEDGVETYIDDIGLFSNSYEDHMKLIKTVVERLQNAGFKINPLKCEWAVQETDFLGHWLTPTGIKPWKKKIEAILKMSKPKNVTQLRAFLGAVTFYRNLWPRRSHLLRPLTALTGKTIFEWTEDCDTAFEAMKAVMASDILMHYPNPNKPFEIYTDASDYQMGAVILQEGKPVAYWSRKLNAAQLNYSVMEKEMLAVVHCLKEFHSMLYGTQLTIFTDHKNLTFKTLNTQRVLRWRMYIEEYCPDFKYCPGKDNVIADCFSRLPRMEKPSDGKNVEKGKLIAFQDLQVKMDPADEVYSFPATIKTTMDMENLPPSEDEINVELLCKFSCCRDGNEHIHSIWHDTDVLDCFLNHPALETMPNPITMANIQQHQLQDQALVHKSQAPATYHQYPIKEISGRNIICYQPPNQANWKLCIPDSLIKNVIMWYHVVLGHRGATSLYATISNRFHNPGLKRKVEALRCEVCQINKHRNQHYAKLPPRHASVAPWDSVAVDLIGPWKIMIAGREIEFYALTCIDPVTNLVELVRLTAKTSQHVAQQFENLWLSRYPKPNNCISDIGGEFIGAPFRALLAKHGIHPSTATSKNATANAVCERMHLVVGNILRTRFNNNAAPSFDTAASVVDNALAACCHAMRCAASKALSNHTPGEVVFRRDMLLDIPVLVDLLLLRDNRQLVIDDNLRRQNSKRREFDYRVGQEVLLKNSDARKLDPRALGPFRVTQVFTNGTVQIQRLPTVVERVNVRRIIPFYRRHI